jgi:hypothetical protein
MANSIGQQFDSGGSGQSQASFRYPQTYRDNHGRRWRASVEIRSGYPTGRIACLHKTPGGNPPPWLPPQGFPFMDVDPTRRDRLFINYEAIIDDRIRAHEELYNRAIEEAGARGLPIPEKGQPWDRRLVAILGTLDQLAAIQPAIAAMQGNSWILGLTDKVDTRLLPFVRKSREEKRQAIYRNLPDFSDASRLDGADVTGDAIAALDNEDDLDGDEWDALDPNEDPVDPSLESRLDLEEQFDASATGGKLQPTPSNKRHEAKKHGRNRTAGEAA